jgi:hypothetical protein
MPVKPKSFLVFANNDGQITRTPAPCSDAKERIRAVKDTIGRGDSDGLGALLREAFTYSEIVDADVTSDSEWSYAWGQHAAMGAMWGFPWHVPVHNQIKYEQWDTHNQRPLIEALFFDYYDEFSVIINMLLNKQSDDCYRTFIASLKNTDISRLFDINMKKVVNATIDLETHVKKMNIPKDEQSLDKYRCAISYVESLYEAAHKYQQDSAKPDEKASPHAEQIKNIKFQLDFNKTMQNREALAVLQRHRGCKQAVLNLAACLGLGIVPYFIALFVKGAVTHQWRLSLFAVNTHSTDLVEKVQDTFKPAHKLAACGA